MTAFPEVVICDAIRTPRGKGRAGGALATMRPVTLLAGLLAELERRSAFRPEDVNDIIIGCVSPVGEQGGPMGRTAALLNGWQSAGPGLQVNRFCASGLEAAVLGAQKIRSGWEEMVVAGGVESMSRVPMFSDGGAWQFDAETVADTRYVPQGISADLIATLGGMRREELDAFAQSSHQKAAAAWENGHFDRSVVPVRDAIGLTLLERDETIRPGTTPEALAALPAVFGATGKAGFDHVALGRYPELPAISHLHSAGNSSAIVDGAALLLMASGQQARKSGLTPRARVLGVAVCASEPVIMLTGPAEAARRALAQAGLGFDDIDLFEVNEAFASVPLHFMAETGVTPERVNVDGGAIAMGHPLGATGAMLIGTLIDGLDRTGGRYGLVTMCIGAGMGSAMVVERVS